MLTITLVGNIVSKSSLRTSFSSSRSNSSLSILKIICVIITRTFLASPCCSAVSDPVLLRVERVKYLSSSIGSVVSGVVAGSRAVGAAVVSCSSSSRYIISLSISFTVA